MGRIIHILTDEEKKIFDAHFLYEKKESHKNFSIFSNDFFVKYDIVNRKRLEGNIDIELIWDEQSNTTVLMHYLENKKFILSNNKLRNLILFSKDVNFVNSQGQTAQMFLFASGNFKNLANINKKFKFNDKIKDQNGNTSHIYFFNGGALELAKEYLNKFKQLNLRMDLKWDIVGDLNEFSFVSKNIVDSFVMDSSLWSENNIKSFMSFGELFNAFNVSSRLVIEADANSVGFLEVVSFSKEMLFVKLNAKLENKKVLIKNKI